MAISIRLALRSTHAVEHPQRTVIAGGFPRIVSNLLFERAQTKLVTNKEEKSHLPENPERYLLRGHLYCATCGYKMLSKSMLNRQDGQAYAYYYCGNQKNKYSECPEQPHVRTDTIDVIVWDEVCLVLERLKTIQAEIERRLQKQLEA
ncbi:MAG TPA: zinc ribbon domain-containing protein, partial [Ktedonobacteraceae bacterium]